ncbi:hypothetical protein [Aeromonas veronii]|uniref:hypothetical protein n=1 Tax=Aeromonas veronii TaxID=654 RepID=UPI003D201770
MFRNANGSYNPSFFFMTIDSDDEINLSIDNNKQTFVHEYIHFLQDLVLPYCIRYNLVKSQHINRILNSGFTQGIIKRPFSGWSDDDILTMKQNDYTWGCHEFDMHNTWGRINKIECNFFKNITSARVFKFNITTESGKEYHVGARDFLEYIAHKIEEKNWKTSHPQYPYKTVDLLFDHLKCSNVPNEVRICIIEYCLYNDNPVERFFVIMKEHFLRNNNRMLYSYSDTKDFLINLAWQGRGMSIEENIFMKTERRLKQLLDELQIKYGVVQFESVSRWINHVIKYTKTYLANKFVFSELYLKNNHDFHSEIDNLVKHIGIPLVFNKNEEYISLVSNNYNKEQFINFYMANGFLNYSTTENPICPMFRFCQNNHKEKMDDDCIKCPTNKTREDNLCVFGVFLKTYSLESTRWL